MVLFQMDCSKLKVFTPDAEEAEGMICIPFDNKLYCISLSGSENQFKLTKNPLEGKTEMKVTVID